MMIKTLLDSGALKWIIRLIFGGAFAMCVYFIFFTDVDALPDGIQEMLLPAFIMSAYCLVLSLSSPVDKEEPSE